MQITETVSEGLRREYKIVVPMGDLDAKVTARLEEMKPRVHLKGFRPGKAPVSFLKKQFGKSMMGEVVEEVVNEASKKAIEDNSLKPAFAPQVEPVGELGVAGLLDRLGTLAGVQRCEQIATEAAAQSIRLYLTGEAAAMVAPVAAAVAEVGGRLIGMKICEASLEDVFIDLTGRSLR